MNEKHNQIFGHTSNQTCSMWCLRSHIMMRGNAPLNSLLCIQSALRFFLKSRRGARYIPQQSKTHVGGSLVPAVEVGHVALLSTLATGAPGNLHLLVLPGGLVVPVCCCPQSHVGRPFRQAVEQHCRAVAQRRWREQGDLSSVSGVLVLMSGAVTNQVFRGSAMRRSTRLQWLQC